MAAFIVISAENRLHYIVDGIEKSRPLNPGISAEISTGKILKADDGGYIYEYTIHGESTKSEKEKSLSSILSNQLAAFRLAYTIPENQLVNIFFLENPLTEKDLDESESWIDEFNKVYKAGTGNDTDFCVFRVVFTYDHNCPCDISSKVDRKVLKRLIDSHKKQFHVIPEKEWNQPLIDTYSILITKRVIPQHYVYAKMSMILRCLAS